MKYFSPSYWFKLWLLSAQLFSDQTKNTNAMLIDKNKDIKNWANKNSTSLDSNSLQSNFLNSAIENITNNQFMTNQDRNIEQFHQTNLDLPRWDQNLTTIQNKKQKNKKRIKRQAHQFTPYLKPTKEILQLNATLIIENNNGTIYQSSFERIIQSLVENVILRPVIDLSRLEVTPLRDNRIFTLNTEHYGYFRMSIQVRVRNEENSRNLELVFRTDNLYLQGFIVNNNYYHFDFRQIYNGERIYNNIIRNNPELSWDQIRRWIVNRELSEEQRNCVLMWTRQPQAVRNGSLPLLTQIEAMPSIQLNGISPDYRDLLPRENNTINWENIFSSFLRLTNEIIVDQERPLGNLARALGQVIFVTAEALRFRSIYHIIVSSLISNGENIWLQRNTQQFGIYDQVLIRWGTESRHFREVIDNNPDQETAISFIIHSITGNDTEEFVPIDRITRELGNLNSRILLGSTILQEWYRHQPTHTMDSIFSCEKNRKKRNLNNYWDQQFCKLEPQIDVIQGQIKMIKILTKDSLTNPWVKKGDILVATTKGLYSINQNGNVEKRMSTVNEEIKDIIINDYSAVIMTKSGIGYYLKLADWSYSKTNFESNDLKKEINIYYDHNKNDHHLHFAPTNSVIRKSKVYTLNLKNINPVDNFQKIQFLGDTDSNCWGTRLKWGDNPNNCWDFTSDCELNECYYQTLTGKSINKFLEERNNQFHDVIKNKEKINENISPADVEQYTPWILQDIDEKYSVHNSLSAAHVFGKHSFGLTWYWENPNYYLQAIFFQYADWKTSESTLDSWFKIGNGIKLYNDNDSYFSNFKKEEKMKELELYYDDNDEKSDVTITHDWYYNHNGNKIIKTFNLSRTNPVDYYNRIEFLGDNENFKLSRVSWGNTPYYSSKRINDFNNQSLYQIIKNYKFDETNKDKIADYTTMVLQPKTTEKYALAVWLEWSQSFGLTWYWEKGHYYLQVISREYANDGGSLSGGTLFIGIGKGIRLYNDELEENQNQFEQSISTSTSTIVHDELRAKRDINFADKALKFDNSTINTTIPSFNIYAINTMDFQNQSVANVSSTNIPII